MSGKVYDWILRRLAGGGTLYAVLLDPDEAAPDENARLAGASTAAGADLILVGGSLTITGRVDETIRAVKEAADTPVIIFPGSMAFVAPWADAILFPSLISGRNPELLIGEHVKMAPLLKAQGLEPIPTAYMLIESGSTTSVEFMSGTTPLPRNKPDIAAAHALAGQYLGMKLAFLEAGSGAADPVPVEMIESVSKMIDIPLIVGGGIRTPEAAASAARSGARIVVTGDVVEKTGDIDLVRSMAEAVHGI